MNSKNKSYNKKINNTTKDNAIPQYGWGSIVGMGLGAALAPFTGGLSLATMGAGASLGSMLGGGVDQLLDDGENTQQKPNFNNNFSVDPLNTQAYYNPVKAYGGYTQKSPYSKVVMNNNIYPMGGFTQPNAEVEGNEVIQHNPNMPPQAVGQGNIQQIASDMSVAQGPTHANGGVPVEAQPGSMVVSDRIPAPRTKEYVSIAHKVEVLGRKKGQLEKKLATQPNDSTIKNALEMTQKQIDILIQQQEELKAQNANNIMSKAFQKAYGGVIPSVKDGSALDPDFMKLWNTGSWAYGGMIPEYKSGGWIQKAINPEHKGYCTPMTKSTCTPHRKALAMRFKHGDLHKKSDGGLIPEFAIGGEYNINDYMPSYLNNNRDYTDIIEKMPYNPNTIMQENNLTPLNINNYKAPNVTTSDVNLAKRNYDAFGMNNILQNGIPSLGYNKIETNNQSNDNIIDTRLNNGKIPPKEPFDYNSLMSMAQYIPDIVGLFTKKNAPINVNEYINKERVTPARYDTSAEEAAVLDARNQALKYAKESSGGDAGAYANMANAGINNSYKNLGQVYNKAQNINMQNNMQAQQINAGLNQNNMQTALQIANMNQADEQAVQQMRANALQGLGTKLGNQASQNYQFKLLESMFPHYKWNSDGTLTFNGKIYSGQDAITLSNQLLNSQASLGMQYAGVKR